jgi:DNA topoisomerase-1
MPTTKCLALPAKRGKGFVYHQANGQPLRDVEHIARIKKLAIPPAYTEAWIYPHPRGHVQATGRDARGRKQYRYHGRWCTLNPRRGKCYDVS